MQRGLSAPLTMKRYLAGLGMTPADYRAKWGLPKNYPVMAHAYAAKRSELAKAAGLGRKAAVGEVAPEPVSSPSREPDAEALKGSVDPELPHAKPAPKKRGRK